MANRTIRKFNPGVFQSDAEVKQQFVVRRHEFNTVMDVLRGNLETESCQHVLVVGPRGRGKTMLLARVAAELRTNDEFSAQMLPVRFTEESHEIFNAADFWLETLFHLARESESVDSSLASEIRESHSGLRRRWNDETVEGRALAAVLDVAGRLGRKLVLMVENLQSLSDAVDEEFGWKLRGALQTEPQIVLVGTATSRFKGLVDAQQPFFELFRTVDLQPLNEIECQALWQGLSDDDVSQRNIRPLQILTGGSPRLLVIVSQFARSKSMRQLMEELVALVDEHTEYFRSHLEALSRTERRVYLAVIDLWYPVGAGEIADRAQMDIRVVSTMLKRLVDRGAVLVEGSNKRSRYSAVERLYCIYYKLRREHNESVIVQNLIRFMKAFYTDSELVGLWFNLILERNRSADFRIKSEKFIKHIGENNVSFLQAIDASFKDINIAKSFLSQSTNPSLNPEDGIVACDRVIEMFSDYKVQAVEHMMVSAAYALKVFHNYNLGNLQEANQIGEVLLHRFVRSNLPPVRLMMAGLLRFRAKINQSLGDYKTVVAISEEMDRHFGHTEDQDLRHIVGDVLECKIHAYIELEEYQLAIRSCDESIERFRDVHNSDNRSRIAWAYYNKISTLQSIGDSDMMVRACDQAIKVFEGVDGSFFSGLKVMFLSKGATISTLLRNTDAALSDLSEALESIKYWPTSRFVFFITPMRSLKLILLQLHISHRLTLDRSEEILVACTELERDLSASSIHREALFAWQAMTARSRALLVQQKHNESMDAFHSAYRIFVPGSELMVGEMLTLVSNLISNGASEAELLKALRIDVKKAAALEPLIVALGERAGESFNVPVEIREVATDIGNFIALAADSSPRQAKQPSRDS